MKISLKQLKQVIKEEVKRSSKLNESPFSMGNPAPSGKEQCEQCGVDDDYLDENGLCEDCADVESGAECSWSDCDNRLKPGTNPDGPNGTCSACLAMGRV